MTNTSDANNKPTNQKEDVKYVVEPGWGRGYVSGLIQTLLTAHLLVNTGATVYSALNQPTDFKPVQPEPVVVKPNDDTIHALAKQAEGFAKNAGYQIEKDYGDVGRPVDLANKGVGLVGELLGVGAVASYRMNNNYGKKKSPKPS